MFMQIKSVIFSVMGALLVAYIYDNTYVGEVCAEPKDPKWGKKGNCWLVDNGTAEICCWKEPDPKDPTKTIEKCQSCTTDDSNQCGPVVIIPKLPQTGPTSSPDGGVLETPPTKKPPKTFGDLGGEVLEVPPENETNGNNTTSDNE
jgi:hypothetical protein